jgi:hypothetical protein
MATYYVETGHGGTDSGTVDNPWLTIDTAMNNVAAGDKVWVKASGTYSETPVMDTVGTTASPIVFEGYTSSTGDNGKVTISGGTNNMTSALAAAYYFFKNFIFTGASSNGVQMFNTDNCRWVNCEFNNSGGSGIASDNSHVFIDCKATGNTTHGFDTDNTATFVGCVSHTNGAVQFNAVNTTLVYKNLAYGPSGSGDHCFSIGTAPAFIGNTMDGENVTGVTGINIQAETDPKIIDNIIYDCDTGVDAGTIIDANTVAAYNLTNSNATADYDFSGVDVGYQDVTSAPAFTDEASDDYTLGAASPAIDAGIQPGGVT